MRKIFLAFCITGILTEVGLIGMKLSGHGVPTGLFLLPLALVVAAILLLGGALISARRSLGTWPRAVRSTAARYGVPATALGYWGSEVLMLLSLRRLFSPTPPGAHGYSRPLRPVVWAITGLTAVETTLVHLLVPSPAWRAIEAAGPQRPGDGAKIAIDDAGTCRLPVLNQVNARLRLSEPVTAHDLFLGEREVRSVEFQCDDPAGLLREVRARIAGASNAGA
ncbi:hypothetical protein V5S96_02215 [Corynebacterium mastitidis]|uniref:Uncharacterized protein n=1 Tax=Corynebacterium mastitidis TaxID=161890 RepID=A0ABU8NWC0_9CORY